MEADRIETAAGNPYAAVSRFNQVLRPERDSGSGANLSHRRSADGEWLEFGRVEAVACFDMAEQTHRQFTVIF
jgi:hypothetical protein